MLYGRDRAAVREAVTFEGTVQDQIVAARQFIAERVQRGEAPSRQQAQSVQVFDYPMVAVREVIANALVHRDYAATDSCAHVRLFDDRLEVCSPGIWVGRDLSPGREFLLSALAGESKKRNIRLAHVLSWIRLVEGEGSGILSAIRDCEDVECPIPIVTQDNGFISVILRSRESGGYRDNDKVSSISLQQVPDIDIAFLTELGGSPAVVEDRVNLVRAIVDRLRSSAGSAVVRAAVFGYRDHEALHRVHARDDDEKLVVGCGLDSVDMVRRELDRAELWCAVPIVSNRAAPVEDALRELSCTSSWRQGVRHVVVILGSRPPHPPVADPGGGLTTPCPHGYAWEDYMTALRERHSVDCLAVVESQLGMTGRDEDRFWARLGEDGMFTGGTSLDRLIEAVVSRPVAELEKSEECR